MSSFLNFSYVTTADIEKEIANLNIKKASTPDNIPTKHLKGTSDICSELLKNIWNEEIINNKIFPSNLKLANITPILKKGDATLSKNYRPVSILPVVSKVFERIMHKQLTNL